MRVAIIDYGSGNLRSATKAFERAAYEAGIAAAIELTADAERVRSADRIVLPGVGAYADCAAGLRGVPGMWEAVEEVAIAKARPFLGICVGMQLMSERGLEKTVTKGFGWIAGDVKEITPADPALKIPQIGWNTVSWKQRSPLVAGLDGGAAFYHVHSFAPLASNGVVLGIAEYGSEFVSAVTGDGVYGVQFHPEKSGPDGLTLLGNFVKLAQ
jgi:glutamine amidotransferase